MKYPRSQSLRAILLVLFIASLALPLILSTWALMLSFSPRWCVEKFMRKTTLEPVYSYVGDDFPEYWPITMGDEVAMTVEETSHYGSRGPDAMEEWASSTPPGSGYLRLGSEYRDFALAMTHEGHCLRIARAALDLPVDLSVDPATLQYCLNYIRQMILCTPDLTLEQSGLWERDFDIERIGATHVCSDWGRVYEELDENWRAWVEHKNNTT